MIAAIATHLKAKERQLYLAGRRARLRQSGFSIIATNCIGGVIYHDLRLEFLSPTVNLTISIQDLTRMANCLKWYMKQPLIVEKDAGEPFPVARIGGGEEPPVRVNFVHYRSFEEAAQKWEERTRKIQWDRIVLLATDRGGCTYEDLRRFDQLPCPNKLLFTHVEYPELASARYIPGFEDQEELGVLVDFKPGFPPQRYLDAFDYVSFLNGVKEWNMETASSR